MNNDPVAAFITELEAAERRRLVAGAHAYARVHGRNDPFALARALCHVRMGICDTITDEHGVARDCSYSANQRP